MREMRDRALLSSAIKENGYLDFMIEEESMNENNIISFLNQLLTEKIVFLYISVHSTQVYPIEVW